MACSGLELEVSMPAHSTFFSTMARCLLFSVAMAILGVTSGCGELPPQATLDEGAKARVQKAQDAQNKFMAKQEAKQRASKVKKR
jgi:hypothetical protein